MASSSKSSTTRHVIAIMGGHKTLGRKVRNAIDLSDLVEGGIPWEGALMVKEQLGQTDAEFAGVIGISERTMSRRRKSRGRLKTVTSDRVYRLARLFSIATNVFEGTEAARRWLGRPQPGLAGRIPLKMIVTEAGAREVEDLLGRIEYGVLP